MRISGRTDRREYEQRIAPPCVVVIFGASGDLTSRKLIPALYNLACDGLLSERTALVGVGRSDLDDARFRALMAEALRSFHTRNVFDEPQAEALLRDWDRELPKFWQIVPKDLVAIGALAAPTKRKARAIA